MALLMVVPSMSNPSKSYEIHKGADGVTYCTCPDWRFKAQKSSDRTCKHLGKFHAQQLAGHSEAVEAKSDAARDLALHAARKANGKRANAARKAIRAGDKVAAAEVVANPKGVSAALIAEAKALLA